MENLHLEPAREPTPSVSLSGISDTEKSKSKSDKETSERSKKTDKDESSVKYTTQSKELSQQQTFTTPQLNLPPLNVQQPTVRTELDKEWETFNQFLNVEGQNI